MEMSVTFWPEAHDDEEEEFRSAMHDAQDEEYSDDYTDGEPWDIDVFVEPEVDPPTYIDDYGYGDF